MRVAAVMVVAAAPALWLPSLAAIWRAAATDPYAGHVPFVPALIGVMAWSRHGWLREGGACPGLGLPVLGIGMALAAAGQALGSAPVHAVAVTVAVAGAIVTVLGVRCLTRLAAPVAFLLFLAPLPRPLVDLVSPGLQHLVAAFARGVLAGLGIPVHQEGLLLHLATVTLSVDRGCNGLRFLMVMLVVTTAFACIYLAGAHRRVLLIAVAVPAAILANCVRVTAIAVLAHALGPQAAAGSPHDYAGRAVWLLALAAVLGLGVALCRDERRGRHPLRADRRISSAISRA